ncbi:Fic family protein, partial [Luteibacter sp.]|uniref:Fic family protein n=1 Tax=Luteibacter sp. TaxID=1886636 RepID=UPI003F7D2F09
AVESNLRRRLRKLGCEDGSLFVELLCEVNRTAGRGSGLIRSSNVGNIGLDGSRIVFPNHYLVAEGLRSLWRWICETGHPSFFQAIVAFCAVTNLHPFADGNGRTARWLFCSLLFRENETGKDFYPLYEYFVRDQGISTLALRKAEVLGEWNPLASYLLDVTSEMIRRRTEAVKRQEFSGGD